MSPATLLLGIVLGMLIASPFTYIWTSRKCLADFTLEQIPLQTVEGKVWKKVHITILERLRYRGIPLRWWTTKIQISEKLDEATLNALAKTATMVLKPTDLTGVGVEIVSRIISKFAKKDSRRCDGQKLEE
jgi:hypothetical protein